MAAKKKLIPSEETIAAMKEVDAGKRLKRYTSFRELRKRLEARVVRNGRA